MDLDPSLYFDEDPEVYRASDDTYLLLNSIVVRRGERFLEVGTGGGTVAVHAARIASVVATDLNPRALRLTAANARENHAELGLVRTDLASALRGPFDVIGFNPPYLEGRSTDSVDVAWAGGGEGSEVAGRFLKDLPRLLAGDGRAYLVLRRTNEAAWSLAHAAFRVKVVASKALFFETLHILELRRKE